MIENIAAKMTKISGNAISKSRFRDRRNFLKIEACIINKGAGKRGGDREDRSGDRGNRSGGRIEHL